MKKLGIIMTVVNEFNHTICNQLIIAQGVNVHNHYLEIWSLIETLRLFSVQLP